MKHKKKLTQKLLKELLTYNPKTGDLIWKKRPLEFFTNCDNPHLQKTSWNTKYAGNIAGSLGQNGYLYTRVIDTHYLVHRLVWLLVHGYTPEKGLDHIDRDKLNNRVENLREVSQSCNMRNKSIQSNNKSGVTGVSWSEERGKWQVYIKSNTVTVGIGRYINFDEAVKARWAAEVKYDYPDCNSTSSAYEYLKENNLLKGEDK